MAVKESRCASVFQSMRWEILGRAGTYRSISTCGERDGESVPLSSAGKKNRMEKFYRFIGDYAISVLSFCRIFLSL